jgi:signal transduction histidine kinase
MENIILYFLHKGANKESVYVEKERTLIIFLLSGLSYSLFSIPLYIYLELNELLNLLYLLLAVTGLLLAYFKLSGNLKNTSVLFTSFCLIYLFLNIIYTGGISSSLVIWITLVQILAIILDLKLIKWTIIGGLLILVSLVIFDYLGLEFSDPMDKKIKTYYIFFNRINFMAVIIFIVFNYDKKKKLDHEKLKKSNIELEQFAYVVSHDMKAPLRSIISFTQLLQRKVKGKIEEKDEVYLDHILNNGHQMNELIQGILDISRIEKQEILTLKATDLNEVLAKIKSNMSNDLEANNVIIEAEKLPIILANEAQIIQMFQNLIENGIKYNRREIPKIVILQQQEGGFLNLYFKDNGIGIAPQYFDKIFEIFKRLHSSYEFTGTGIGLAICKKIAIHHKGDLVVEESSDTGTTFKISLPME